MKMGPRLLAFDAARRRLVRQLLPGVVGVRRMVASPVRDARTTASRIRPMQFIGVIPTDVAQEKAR
jgi:hypothetical protein